MEQNSGKKSWGGARSGAGRKRTAVKSCTFYATPEVAAILAGIEGSKSEFINRCILRAAGAGGRDGVA
ncbi:MAG: hypothetical protein IJ767_06090 [Bacteroidaceae bacterium]|nr:hypothetical protein [Bacteroidaceae bacterium]